MNPSEYLHWEAIGDISFTTDWKEYDGIMTINDEMDGCWSIAFNLNSNEKSPTDFYFDDLSWSVNRSGSPEPYAVLTDNTDVVTDDGNTLSGKTLTFYYDDQKAIRGGTDIKPFNLGWYDEVWTVNSGWHEQCKALTNVVFDESFANCTTLTSTDYWFWLRQLTHHGLAQATQIEANTPYLISMPNNAEYSAEFNQAGRVTFSSQNVEVPVTQLNGMEAQTGAGDMVLLQPNFKGQSATAMIYALNVGELRDGHPEGSVFEANYRAVRPFEAFTVHHGNGPAPQFISVFEMNGDVTGIEDVRCKMSDGRGDNWYDLNGRRLQQKPAQKGVYLNNGRKVVVR